MTTATASRPATARLPQKRTYSLREVAGLFGVRVETIRNWVRDGRFPRPLPVSPHKLLWAAADVEGVLAGQTAGTVQATGKRQT